jgi:hypothetical protein
MRKYRYYNNEAGKDLAKGDTLQEVIPEGHYTEQYGCCYVVIPNGVPYERCGEEVGHIYVED